MMDGMTVHFDRVRSTSLNTIKDMKTVNDHKALLAAIAGKNSQEAVSHLEKYPNYFSEV